MACPISLVAFALLLLNSHAYAQCGDDGGGPDDGTNPPPIDLPVLPEPDEATGPISPGDSYTPGDAMLPTPARPGAANTPRLPAAPARPQATPASAVTRGGQTVARADWQLWWERSQARYLHPQPILDAEWQTTSGSKSVLAGLSADAFINTSTALQDWAPDLLDGLSDLSSDHRVELMLEAVLAEAWLLQDFDNFKWQQLARGPKYARSYAIQLLAARHRPSDLRALTGLIRGVHSEGYRFRQIQTAERLQAADALGTIAMRSKQAEIRWRCYSTLSDFLLDSKRTPVQVQIACAENLGRAGSSLTLLSSRVRAVREVGKLLAAMPKFQEPVQAALQVALARSIANLAVATAEQGVLIERALGQLQTRGVSDLTRYSAMQSLACLVQARDPHFQRSIQLVSKIALDETQGQIAGAACTTWGQLLARVPESDNLLSQHLVKLVSTLRTGSKKQAIWSSLTLGVCAAERRLNQQSALPAAITAAVQRQLKSCASAQDYAGFALALGLMQADAAAEELVSWTRSQAAASIAPELLHAIAMTGKADQHEFILASIDHHARDFDRLRAAGVAAWVLSDEAGLRKLIELSRSDDALASAAATAALTRFRTPAAARALRLAISSAATSSAQSLIALKGLTRLSAVEPSRIDEQRWFWTNPMLKRDL